MAEPANGAAGAPSPLENFVFEPLVQANIEAWGLRGEHYANRIQLALQEGDYGIQMDRAKFLVVWRDELSAIDKEISVGGAIPLLALVKGNWSLLRSISLGSAGQQVKVWLPLFAPDDQLLFASLYPIIEAKLPALAPPPKAGADKGKGAEPGPNRKRPRFEIDGKVYELAEVREGPAGAEAGAIGKDVTIKVLAGIAADKEKEFGNIGEKFRSELPLLKPADRAQRIEAYDMLLMEGVEACSIAAKAFAAAIADAEAPADGPAREAGAAGAA